MKVVTIIGTRPQFIKAAVLSRLVRQTPGIREVLIHTGQHHDPMMSDVFFDELDLPRPDHRLELPAVRPLARLGIMFTELERIILTERPDQIWLYGDTDTTLAGAVTAARLHVPAAHIEAGLRSFDRSMPEEVNRVLTDHAARWLFCPTDAAVANLAREGITDRVHRVGDVMCDALFHYQQRESPLPTLERLNLQGQPYALGTLHRAGNTDDRDRFDRLWQSLCQLTELLPIVLPLHPRSRQVLRELRLAVPDRLHVVDPVGYLEMLKLEQHARLIVTDSGGVQKEAYLQGVPCLTLRDNTEWLETVTAGWNRLVGADPDQILAEAERFLRQGPPPVRPDLYGNGRAGEQILQILRAA